MIITARIFLGTIIVVLILLVAFNYGVFIRLFDSISSFCYSFYFMICKLFKIDNYEFNNIFSTIVNIPNNSAPGYLPVDDTFILPLITSFDEMKILFNNYLKITFSYDYFEFTFFNISNLSYFISQTLLFATLLIALYFCIRMLMFTDVDATEKGYTVKYTKWLLLLNKICLLINNFIVVALYEFKKMYFCIPIFVLIFLSANIFSIIFDVFAYYFELLGSLNFFLLFELCFVILYSLWPIISFIPLALWIVIGYMLLNEIRLRMALNKLIHLESKNTEFANTLGVVNIVEGKPGTGKTTFITAISLSLEKSWRWRLKDNMQNMSIYFPHFNPVYLRDHICELKSLAKVFNKVQMDEHIDTLITEHLSSGNMNIFGYDITNNSVEFFDGRIRRSFFDELKNFAISYYYYSSYKSYIYGNYTIQAKQFIVNKDYTPEWMSHYFDRKQYKIFDLDNTRSNVIDMNGFRITKKKESKSNSTYSNSIYSFGIFTFTELDKEFGNQNSNKPLDAKSYDANALNDGTNLFFKMGRHVSIIDNSYYFCVIGDMQRIDDISAQYSGIAQTKICLESSIDKFAIPFFYIELMILDMLSNFRRNNLTKLNSVRNSYGKLHFLLNSFFIIFDKLYMRLKRQFSYSEIELTCTNVNAAVISKFYRLDALIYANRFATDTHFGSFSNILREAKGGLETDPTFGELRATQEELKSTNSYFVDKIAEATNVHHSSSNSEEDFYE